MKQILFRLTGILIFAYLLLGVVGVENFLHTLANLSVWVLLLIVPFHFAQWSLRIFRWQILLRNELIRLSFWETCAIATAGFMIGSLTPGRLGEFSKVKFLMNGGYPFTGAFMSSLIERLLDIGALCFYVILGIFICFTLLPEGSWKYLALSVMTFAGILLLYLRRNRLRILLMRLIPEKIASGLENKSRVFLESFSKITPDQWFSLALHSLLIWGLNYWMIFLLFRAAGFDLPLHYALAFAAFGSLAGLIPLSIYGVGIREAVLLLFFSQIYPGEKAVEASLIFGLMYLILLLYHLLLGFLFWLSPLLLPFLKKSEDRNPA
ncbi:MAG: lysylphosphatidylglycerol synthase transmembrane domain-containing protein [bacterium]